ncbi:Xaa-Pro peptidase family protein [Acidipila sp. EB88]|uniref:M24 family metallopeptidase n=1 Tax=Acidipila sp. EB88 TaxID=2305226 RepID=UPI000F5E614A|nr:M24 family metallopeptidase [Acidipila sp. EB88]RRA47756.1 M24 family metallopeptidase [Acidipila sp. EB88]
MAALDLAAIQSALRANGLDAWLFYDHHGRDPLAYSVLGLPPAVHVTRRWYYVIPAHGDPKKLVHRIESGRLDALPGARAVYSSWQELEYELEQLLSACTRIAMQYSPRNAIMYISLVDAGTVELVRSFGKEIRSSADLISQFEAVLSAAQIESHYIAQRAIDTILPAAWHWLRAELDAARPITEYSMQSWLVAALEREGLQYDNRPNVSVNHNAADSHYDPKPGAARPIHNGDFLLVDIWGRPAPPSPSDFTVFYDVTWTGVIGREPSEREQTVFRTVRDARDAAIALVRQRFAAGEPVAGWEPDAAARAVITAAGFGPAFTHRTGHNIAREIHGAGAHLDNFETHDVRRILPNTCFSVEPGVYLDTFGVRSEINMITSATEARVTGRIQQELVRI